MNLIEKLNDVSNSPEELSSFLKGDINFIYDFFVNQSYPVIGQYKDEIDTYIFSKYSVFKKLDLSNNENYTFITLLLDISERFGFLLYFQRIHRILIKNECNVSKRHQASALILLDNRIFKDYENKLENILLKLQDAFENEEDNSDNVVTTFTNFYSKIILDFGEFNPIAVRSLIGKIKGEKEKFHFLQKEFIKDILIIDTVDFTSAYNNIQLELDNYLNRKSYDLIFTDDKNLIEEKSEYCVYLNNITVDFMSIQIFCSEKHVLNGDDSIFHSLGRGVNILDKEEQLYAYMHSFGKMHYHKLISSFELLPIDFFSKKIDIIDWGCGQAIASISYLEYLKINNYNQEINLLTINEPSEIAIKRGNLHIQLFDDKLNILTINKDLDSLKKNNFKNSNNIKLHFFSNILDIDDYNVDKLSDLVNSTFNGTNYFIISSPYMTDIKRHRIDNFVDSFENNVNFELIKSIDNRKGEWMNDWSRVLRIFKADI